MAGTKERRVTGRSRKGKLVRRLSADEAKAVLDCCIAAYPDFESKAERVARSVLAEVSFKDVADDVESAICLLDSVHRAIARPLDLSPERRCSRHPPR